MKRGGGGEKEGKKGKRDVGQVVMSCGCEQEEDNNIVNQMWLRLLLPSQPWHLLPLTHAKGTLFAKPAAIKLQTTTTTQSLGVALRGL